MTLNMGHRVCSKCIQYILMGNKSYYILIWLSTLEVSLSKGSGELHPLGREAMAA